MGSIVYPHQAPGRRGKAGTVEVQDTDGRIGELKSPHPVGAQSRCPCQDRPKSPSVPHNQGNRFLSLPDCLHGSKNPLPDRFRRFHIGGTLPATGNMPQLLVCLSLPRAEGALTEPKVDLEGQLQPQEPRCLYRPREVRGPEALWRSGKLTRCPKTLEPCG